MFYAYILRSINNPNEIYKGFTGLDVNKRLAEHNIGNVPSTKDKRPWEVVWYGAFETKKQALDFEKYLKSASGIAFLRKRLILHDIQNPEKTNKVIFKSSLKINSKY